MNIATSLDPRVGTREVKDSGLLSELKILLFLEKIRFFDNFKSIGNSNKHTEPKDSPDSKA